MCLKIEIFLRYIIAYKKKNSNHKEVGPSGAASIFRTLSNIFNNGHPPSPPLIIYNLLYTNLEFLLLDVINSLI